RWTLPSTVRGLFPDNEHHRMVVQTDEGAWELTAHPERSWRTGVAICGGLVAALALLLALRLFGSRRAAIVAALCVAVDGLAFVMSRYANNLSFSTAFGLAAWFCAASAVHARRRRHVRELWLLGSGLAAGLAIASHWAGASALFGSA